MSEAEDKICPILLAVRLIVKPEEDVADEDIICIGKRCGGYSRVLEGCGLRSSR